MTRINTNVSSLTAQKSLARSNLQLQQALTRLSTGLRINVGKDDPAGLIASEALRSDIASTQQAITNNERAGQMIGTADSALGQVSSLLTDIRGLVTQAANTGAMSDNQIAANQLQVDASLDALNRIAQVTNFQGRRLLDGSLDFVTIPVAGMTTVRDMHVDSATLPSSGTLGVSVAITSAATQAKITDTGFSTGAKAASTFSFAPGATLTNFAANGSVDIFSNSLDTKYDNVTIAVVADANVTVDGQVSVAFDGATLQVGMYDHAGNTITTQAVVDAVNNATTGIPEFHAYTPDGTKTFTKAADLGVTTATTGTTGLTVAAKTKGATYNNMAIVFKSAALGAGAASAVYSATDNVITVTLDSTSPVALTTIETKIEAIKGNGAQLFDVDVNMDAGTLTERTTVFGGAGADKTVIGNTASSGENKIGADLVFQLTGLQGSQVFTFNSGADILQIAAQINMRTDVTGIVATANINGTSGVSSLDLKSQDYGSAAFVDVGVISEGATGTFKDLLDGTRDAGTDIVASVNGAAAAGKGNTLSVNSSGLSMTATVADGSSTAFSFNVSEGALFQLGPDVVSGQQARLGIRSVNAASLGGATGRLYELGSGGSAALATDPAKASKIINEVIDKVTGLRGRLGAFQKTTIDANKNTLADAVENLTAAESSIRDADFASESANLTRAQILVQAGTSVLAVANRNPENVLALLR